MAGMPSLHFFASVGDGSELTREIWRDFTRQNSSEDFIAENNSNYQIELMIKELCCKMSSSSEECRDVWTRYQYLLSTLSQRDWSGRTAIHYAMGRGRNHIRTAHVDGKYGLGGVHGLEAVLGLGLFGCSIPSAPLCEAGKSETVTLPVSPIGTASAVTGGQVLADANQESYPAAASADSTALTSISKSGMLASHSSRGLNGSTMQSKLSSMLLLKKTIEKQPFSDFPHDDATVSDDQHIHHMEIGGEEAEAIPNISQKKKEAGQSCHGTEIQNNPVCDTVLTTALAAELGNHIIIAPQQDHVKGALASHRSARCSEHAGGRTPLHCALYRGDIVSCLWLLAAVNNHHYVYRLYRSGVMSVPLLTKKSHIFQEAVNPLLDISQVDTSVGGSGWAVGYLACQAAVYRRRQRNPRIYAVDYVRCCRKTIRSILDADIEGLETFLVAIVVAQMVYFHYFTHAQSHLRAETDTTLQCSIRDHELKDLSLANVVVAMVDLYYQKHPQTSAFSESVSINVLDVEKKRNLFDAILQHALCDGRLAIACGLNIGCNVLLPSSAGPLLSASETREELKTTVLYDILAEWGLYLERARQSISPDIAILERDRMSVVESLWITLQHVHGFYRARHACFHDDVDDICVLAHDERNHELNLLHDMVVPESSMEKGREWAALCSLLQFVADVPTTASSEESEQKSWAATALHQAVVLDRVFDSLHLDDESTQSFSVCASTGPSLAAVISDFCCDVLTHYFSTRCPTASDVSPTTAAAVVVFQFLLCRRDSRGDSVLGTALSRPLLSASRRDVFHYVFMEQYIFPLHEFASNVEYEKNHPVLTQHISVLLDSILLTAPDVPVIKKDKWKTEPQSIRSLPIVHLLLLRYVENDKQQYYYIGTQELKLHLPVSVHDETQAEQNSEVDEIEDEAQHELMSSAVEVDEEYFAKVLHIALFHFTKVTKAGVTAEECKGQKMSSNTISIFRLALSNRMGGTSKNTGDTPLHSMSFKQKAPRGYRMGFFRLLVQVFDHCCTSGTTDTSTHDITDINKFSGLQWPSELMDDESEGLAKQDEGLASYVVVPGVPSTSFLRLMQQCVTPDNVPAARLLHSLIEKRCANISSPKSELLAALFNDAFSSYKNQSAAHWVSEITAFFAPRRVSTSSDNFNDENAATLYSQWVLESLVAIKPAHETDAFGDADKVYYCNELQLLLSSNERSVNIFKKLLSVHRNHDDGVAGALSRLTDFIITHLECILSSWRHKGDSIGGVGLQKSYLSAFLVQYLTVFERVVLETAIYHERYGSPTNSRAIAVNKWLHSTLTQIDSIWLRIGCPRRPHLIQLSSLFNFPPSPVRNQRSNEAELMHGYSPSKSEMSKALPENFLLLVVPRILPVFLSRCISGHYVIEDATPSLLLYLVSTHRDTPWGAVAAVIDAATERHRLLSGSDSSCCFKSSCAITYNSMAEEGSGGKILTIFQNTLFYNEFGAITHGFLRCGPMNDLSNSFSHIMHKLPGCTDQIINHNGLFEA